MPNKLSLSEHTLDINMRKCDVTRFDFSEVEEYVRALTGDREYQYDAIKRILIYLWGGMYKSITDLARENYQKKSAIQQRFHSEEHFLRLLPLPDRLSGVCHLATGTGKSYVMFAVAYLSILLGKVRRVMVVGPSSTVIESGLREKFNEYLYGEKSAELKPCLPEQYRHKVIKLLKCNDVIEDDSIVIENINAIYTKDRNSIGDTLFSHSGEVLVLSDEVHHAYSHLTFSGEAVGYDFTAGREGQGDVLEERLWMKYIREEPLIKRHIGFTGTPYNANEYFPDVICNYSIKDAIDEKIIKRINPIIKTETDEGDSELTRTQRFEQIIDTHADNKKKYSYSGKDGKSKVKPITIFINPTQAAAQRNTDEFVKVLADVLKKKDPACGDLPRSALEQVAREKVICVISKLGEAEYKQKLEQVEQVDPEKVGGKVEFIFAVNKLSEGWDVDSVFQIVPAEERVFNSKLLISQVLGRGLRLPRKVNLGELQQNYPVVTVTNHDRFAKHITELLDEVTECEMRLSSHVLTDPNQKRCGHHFSLFNLKYLPAMRVVERSPEETQRNGIRRELILTPSGERLNVRVTYLKGTKRFKLSKEFFTVDQIVLEVERRFKNTVFESSRFDFGDDIVLDQVPGRAEIERIITSAMARAGIEGDRLSLENRQQIDLFFNQFLPKGKKKVIRERIEGEIEGISTTDMQQSSVRAGSLDHDTSFFLSEDYENELNEQNLFILKELTGSKKQLPLEEAWLTAGGFSAEYIRQIVAFKHLYAANPSLFRTPQDLVILNHQPEQQFVFRLIEDSKCVNAWIKSPDRDFYSIDYEYWKGGRDRVRRSFNPDFFIRIKIRDCLLRIPQDAPAVERLRHLEDQGLEELILVVEIKSDDDQRDETRAKEQYARDHFTALNQRLREANPADFPDLFRAAIQQQYIFYLLRPADYPQWFGHLRSGTFVFDLVDWNRNNDGHSE
jgi:type III restriction enzyme